MTTPPLSLNALTIMKKRYLERRPDGTQETIDEFFDRISMDNPDYHTMLSNLDFLPNSPTLFNLFTHAGGTLSACFKFTVEDTLFDSPNGIIPVLNKAVKVLKAGGGVGYTLKVREEGAEVASTHRSALGPLGVLRMYHRMALEITQGGKRDAAQMGILDCEHPDIRKFIHVKDDDPDGLGTFNISVSITDDWMRKAQEEGSKQSELLDEMAQSAWKTGDPGVFFYDRVNRDNPTPWIADLDGTNPCGEVPLMPNEPCNLGSINLAHFVKQPDFDWERLDKTVRLAIRYLDDVLDVNDFPDHDIDKAARQTRKLGLGVCGWADALALLRIHYDSAQAVNMGETVARFIRDIARKESEVLADDKGIAPCFAEQGPRQRNATVTCIAPTGTIAILMDASSGIEPHFALENTRTMGDGTVLDESVFFDGFTPHVSSEIDPYYHIAHQAAWQKSTDLGISKTINLPNSATWQDVRKAYVDMWESGCKGGTIYRDGSRENQVLKSAAIVPQANGKRSLPRERLGVTNKFTVGSETGYFTLGYFDTGEPGELFIRVAKQGSEVNGLYDAIGILTSMALQHGTPFDALVDKMAHLQFEPAGLTQDADVPTATSILDFIFRKAGARLGHAPSEASTELGMRCPDCDGKVQHLEGCVICAQDCGWSKC